MPQLPDYSLCGKFNGSKFAARWLTQLSYDMKRHDVEPSTKKFFEAVEILFDEEAALWLDLNLWYRLCPVRLFLLFPLFSSSYKIIRGSESDTLIQYTPEVRRQALPRSKPLLGEPLALP